jgi:hypothetical protein
VQVSELASPKHAGEEIRQSALAKAQRITQEELRILGWSLEDLRSHRKGDARKVLIAARLRRETTMTLDWIAARLYMGGPARRFFYHLASLLHRLKHNQTSGKALF